MLIDKCFPDYPYLNGTGFFCRLAGGTRYFYVTALHCLNDSDHHKDMDNFPLLKVAYRTSLETHIVSESVRFEVAINVSHGCADKLGIFEDVLIYTVDPALTQQQENILRWRALIVREPSWYRNLFQRIDPTTHLRVIGYPKDSTTRSEIVDGKAQTQRRFLWGLFSNTAHYPDRKSIERLNWQGERITGFSGAPVLLQEERLLGIESIPVGVVLTGNSQRLEFLEMSRVADMLLHLERHGLSSPEVSFRYSS
ncbi:hypothetical protein [Metapseudomonas otitidis]|uniref:hypothetical protein n=1 Tax=Metapseudomonas otitidis TaxID=319939 RepID=UPI001CA429EE|nr:hypothetical protein [Pseudomonas otitidis]QZX85776.1 hypothetical protein K6751_14080 [Pseudomonas otitidis]